jgi:hypothetical protein
MAFQSLVQIFRDFIVDGVPSSGKNNPKKSDIRSWGAWVESLLNAIGVNSGTVYTTRAALFLDLTKSANTMAWVTGDPTVAYNGIYQKIGAANTGSWNRVGDLPYSFIRAENAGVGTANAIQATTTMPISGSALVVLPIVVTNTASPVTVSFNGDVPLTIKSNSGNDIVSGGLVIGMMVFGIVVGSTFRILNDQVSGAIVAAAEAAAADAATYKDAALAAVPNAFPATLSAFKALPTSTIKNAYFSGSQWQFRSGNYSTQITADTLGGMFVKANDTASASGAWVRVFTGLPMLEWFGGANDGVVDNAAALVALVAVYGSCSFFGNGGTYLFSTAVTLTDKNVNIDGLPSTVLKFTGSAQLWASGSTSALPNLGSFMRTDRNFAAFATAHGLSVGEWFLAYIATASSWFAVSGRDYRAAEFFTVASIDNSTQVRVFGRPHDTYQVSGAASMYKVNGIACSIKNVKLSAGTASAIRVTFGRDVRVRDVQGQTADYSVLEFDRCYGGLISGYSGWNSSVTTDAYSLALYSCTDFAIDGGTPSASRHAIALGSYSAVIGGGPNRNIRISNMTLRNADRSTSSVGASDIHGCNDMIQYHNCHLESGAVVGGRNVSYKDCVIYSIPNFAAGYAVYGSEIAGGFVEFSNCTFIVNGDLSTGCIFLSPGNNMLEDLRIIGNNLKMLPFAGFSSAGATAAFLYMTPNNMNKPLHIELDGVRMEMNTMDACVTVAEQGSPPSNISHIYVNSALFKAPAGNRYFVKATSGVAGKKIFENGTVSTTGGNSGSWPN